MSYISYTDTGILKPYKLYDKNGNGLPEQLLTNWYPYDPQAAYVNAGTYGYIPNYDIPPFTYQDLIYISNTKPIVTMDNWLKLRSMDYEQLLKIAPEYKLIYGYTGNKDDLFYYTTIRPHNLRVDFVHNIVNYQKVDNRLIRARRYLLFTLSTKKLLHLLYNPNQPGDYSDYGLEHKKYAMGNSNSLINKWEPIINNFDLNINNPQQLSYMIRNYKLDIPDHSEYTGIAIVIYVAITQAIINDPFNHNPVIILE